MTGWNAPGSQPADQILADIADYVTAATIDSEEAYQTAILCLMDSLGCGLLALKYPDCVKLLGPVVPGAVLPGGVRIPGTSWELDLFQAAFNIGTMIRWLDYNDTWLAAEWGHPSDNLGALLACADYLNRAGATPGRPKLTVHDLLTAMIKAHEIQGVLALENSFNRLGLDHVLLVRIASTAVATAMLGGNREQVIDAVSNAWLDGAALRTYRHAPNTGSRKSWAAGDATSRAVRLALWTLRGEMGYPAALTTPFWGVYDVLLEGHPLLISQPFGSYVMENVLFKISYPAEFHAQTAVEAAVQLHPTIRTRLDDIDEIRIDTHEAALRIIDKVGPLRNPADRDHCMQYMVAVALLHGTLNSDHYLDASAADPRIDALREKMILAENVAYSFDYLNPTKRSIASAVQIVYKDGTVSERIEVEYPIGHRRRRAEGIPLLHQKFEANVASRFGETQQASILKLFESPETLTAMPVDEFMDHFVQKS